MREFKFRAWSEKTTDLRWEYAWNTMEEIFSKTEPYKNSPEWELWYENRNDYVRELLEKWDTEHNSSERYIRTKEMITNFMINDKIQRPCNHEIIDVMQYTGVHDGSNDEIEIYESDIVEFEYEEHTYTGEVKFEAGTFIIVSDHLPDGYITILDIINSDNDYFWIDGNVIGNIYENPDLRI